jgi:hypothetical protein
MSESDSILRRLARILRRLARILRRLQPGLEKLYLPRLTNTGSEGIPTDAIVRHGDKLRVACDPCAVCLTEAQLGHVHVKYSRARISVDTTPTAPVK